MSAQFEVNIDRVRQSFRYAGIFFVTAISNGDNELITLEYIHRYVEVLDKYFNNVRPFAVEALRILMLWIPQVCEMDIIFNYQKVTQLPPRLMTRSQAYYILDEIMSFGHFYNSNRNDALQAIALQETCEDTETLQQVWPDMK